MPVSGFVVILASEPRARASALHHLASEPALTLGPLHEHALPVVLESASTEACTETLRALEALEGVLAVRPVFHDFSDEVPDHAAT
jgi:nitrate reductase NapAB chaperone NapD